MTESHDTASASSDMDDHDHVHVVPLSVLVNVFVALYVLTFLTVAGLRSRPESFDKVREPTGSPSRM